MQIGSKKWHRLIEDGADELNIALDQEKIELLERHAVELLHWNQTINLTAITDPVKIAINHFLDSLAPAPMIPANAYLLDIGSGGGFPGVPLKIVLPSITVTLIDSSRKKISFLKHVIRTLGLQRIEAYHVSAEAFATCGDFGHYYDVIISRALSSMDTFIHMALPLLSKNGIIVMMRGKLTEQEIESVRLCLKDEKPKPLLTTKSYRLPYFNAERSLVISRRPCRKRHTKREL